MWNSLKKGVTTHSQSSLSMRRSRLHARDIRARTAKYNVAPRSHTVNDSSSLDCTKHALSFQDGNNLIHQKNENTLRPDIQSFSSPCYTHGELAKMTYIDNSSGFGILINEQHEKG